MTLAEVLALDGWSGWETTAAVDQGRLSAAVGRALHRWHVRWLMGHLDAMVASGQYGYYEEGDAILSVDTSRAVGDATSICSQLGAPRSGIGGRACGRFRRPRG